MPQPGSFHRALSCLALALLSALCLAAQSPEVRPEIGIGIGLDLGLEQILRGGGIEVSLGVQSPAWFPGLVLGVEGDRSLGSWWVCAALSIPIGSGLEALIGSDAVIGSAFLMSGGGRSLALATRGFPSRFGLAARLGRVPIAESWKCDFNSSIDWRVLAASQAFAGGIPSGFVRTDSLATFVAGFTARLEARLVLSP
ncbi:MAG: hypothetical protein WCQ50_16550 [Spirochaetota bacterium]